MVGSRKILGASEGAGGADGGGAEIGGGVRDTVWVERAFGTLLEVLSRSRSGVKRNSRGCGEVVFGVVAGRFFSAGICAGAGADGFGCFFSGDGGLGFGRRRSQT